MFVLFVTSFFSVVLILLFLGLGPLFKKKLSQLKIIVLYWITEPIFLSSQSRYWLSILLICKSYVLNDFSSFFKLWTSNAGTWSVFSTTPTIAPIWTVSTVWSWGEDSPSPSACTSAPPPTSQDSALWTLSQKQVLHSFIYLFIYFNQARQECSNSNFSAYWYWLLSMCINQFQALIQKMSQITLATVLNPEEHWLTQFYLDAKLWSA